LLDAADVAEGAAVGTTGLAAAALGDPEADGPDPVPELPAGVTTGGTGVAAVPRLALSPRLALTVEAPLLAVETGGLVALRLALGRVAPPDGAETGGLGRRSVNRDISGSGDCVIQITAAQITMATRSPTTTPPRMRLILLNGEAELKRP
jgi:hypothetical protein